MGQAEGCYQAVDGLADGKPASTEGTIVLGGGYGEICPDGWEDFELRESSPDLFELRVFANPLQDFAKDEVGQAQALPIQFAVEPVGVEIADSAEIVDPDS